MIDIIKAVLSVVSVLVATLLVLFVISLFFDPVTETEACSDDGGRWNPELKECECTREELGHPQVSKERIAYCDKNLWGQP